MPVTMIGCAALVWSGAACWGGAFGAGCAAAAAGMAASGVGLPGSACASAGLATASASTLEALTRTILRQAADLEVSVAYIRVPSSLNDMRGSANGARFLYGA